MGRKGGVFGEEHQVFWRGGFDFGEEPQVGLRQGAILLEEPQVVLRHPWRKAGGGMGMRNGRKFFDGKEL